MKTDFKAIDFCNDQLIFIDQVKLPLVEEYISTDNYERIAEAIEKLEIRGAPAIGIAAAYALALSQKNVKDNFTPVFEKAYQRLHCTRPTAVNLFWALEQMRSAFLSSSSDPGNIYQILLQRAKEIHLDDINKCKEIGRHGLSIFNKRSVVLTHCNAGQLATGGAGTALSVIKQAYEHGFVDFVFADETRPLFQGSRLTAFELEKANIPFAINTDSMSGFLMQQKKIDLVVTGADRIAVNGDTANKIGTYNLAVLCKFHNIPFYIAAPTSTIDKNCLNGQSIKIEFRDKNEVVQFNGTAITKNSYEVYSPAFDVTPSELISGIITEIGLFKPSFDFSNV